MVFKTRKRGLILVYNANRADKERQNRTDVQGQNRTDGLGKTEQIYILGAKWN